MKKKIVYVLAILAAGSTAAVAKDVKQDKKAKASAVSASEMTDAEMDRVTAGLYFVNNDQIVDNPGQGNLPGCYCASGIGRWYGTPAVDTAAYLHGAKLPQ
jgi:hypothetical protein